MKDIFKKIKVERLYFDGGTGTVLQKNGLNAGEAPEIMNRRAPEVVKQLHLDYIMAGADIIKTNTFGVNSLKYKNVYDELSLALTIAREAVEESGREVYIAFDVGPTGRMLKPYGDLGFEEAVAVYAENMKYAESLGADIILIETMSDIYETKAAVLAAKENSTLPIFVTCAFGTDGKLLTGADPIAVISMLEGMGVSAIGMNCSVGPRSIREVLSSFVKYSSLPIIVNPNAGLPSVVNGETVYDLNAQDFAALMKEICLDGATVLGGCCGTTPDYIRELRSATCDLNYTLPDQKNYTVISSYTHGLTIGKKSVIIGERINPTGKAKLKEALRSGDVSYILSLAIQQEKNGAHVLDVNVGLADIDEKETLHRIIPEIQAICDLPLQIDTGSAEAMEAAMRIYSGKPLVNSVNGSKQSMADVFPLVKKYGGTVIALTMDESGIPESVEGRVEIAKKIAARAEEYGISKKDIIFDPLTLTVASGKDNAVKTLETMKKIKTLGYKCSLGVSNVSFGLPERELLNSSFYVAALMSGLDLAIINPTSVAMMNAYNSYLALSGAEGGCLEYVEKVTSQAKDTSLLENSRESDIPLSFAIRKGLKKEAVASVKNLILNKNGTEIINEEIIPALNDVGEDFEKGKVYLPGLLMSAEAASAAFSIIRDSVKNEPCASAGTVVLATVKGDIHDIGKNIVKLILESYGYRVIDLGRNVDKKEVLSAMHKNPGAFLGLSALMTTTLDAMKETVELVKAEISNAKVMVGGAVLTETYAKRIGADFYAPDALSAVKYLDSITKQR